MAHWIGVDVDDDTRLRAKIEELESENAELYRKTRTLAEMLDSKVMGIWGYCAAADCNALWRADISRMPLCQKHLTTAGWDWHDNVLAPLMQGDATWEEHVDDLERAQERLRVIRTPPTSREGTSAVYYVRFDTRVKIGTTVNLTKRLAAFHAHPDQLLAVEAGSYERERERHKQFSHLRVGKSELFTVAPDLTDHIDVVRAMFGDPHQFLN